MRLFVATRTSSILEEHGGHHLDWIIAALYSLLSLLAITTPQGPGLHYPPTYIYFSIRGDSITSDSDEPKAENVCRSISGSLWNNLLFSYTQPVLELGKRLRNIDIGDLPVLPANMRATYNYSRMRIAHQINLPSHLLSGVSNCGWTLGYRLISLNSAAFTAQFILAILSAITNYGPAMFLQLFVKYLEVDAEKKDWRRGWIYVAGLTTASVLSVLISQQLWKVSMSDLEVRIRLQLNSMLFAKTLIRKDVALTSAPSTSNKDEVSTEDSADGFTSKAQVMTLMTTDADRVSDFAWHIFALIDSPIEILVGLSILYHLLGRSSIIGISTLILFLPINHVTGKFLIRTQEKLMKARDERVSLMNEILGGIRMIKFMAWERSFIQRVHEIRDTELKHQRSTFTAEILWTFIWNASPIIVILATFYDFAVIRQQELTPSIAFPSIIVFSTLKYALNALPEALVKMMQSLVSLRRIAKYLDSPELSFLPQEGPPTTTPISLENCTIAWPGRGSFSLIDVNVRFPVGKISLVCGKVGSGKSLLLYALLGEAEIVSGTFKCPRTPLDFQSLDRNDPIVDEDWIVDGICAYVPQTVWLRNASIRDNILFNLPYNFIRYQRTLEACALLNDLNILEDGDLSEIGERGVNLSGGQKARVSLARAVYSRASTLFLDDVLSAVDAQTASHIYHECLKGDLMHGRSTILVSHHVHLCASGADYVVALENGRVNFEGSPDLFLLSEFSNTLVSSSPTFTPDGSSWRIVPVVVEQVLHPEKDSTSQLSEPSVAVTLMDDEIPKKSPRKLVEEEKRAVGSIDLNVWLTYFKACGATGYWTALVSVLMAAAVCPVLENAWLKHWAGREVSSGLFSFSQDGNAVFYISVYAGLSIFGLAVGALRWLVLYSGSLRASSSLYSNLLEVVLFSKIRFHDTVSRGRLLNRFGRDFEVTDSQLSNDLGHALTLSLSALTSLVTIGAVAGFPFLLVLVVLGVLYTRTAKIYGQTCRELRRLESVTRSPLYSIYGETISGAAVLRAFGACSVSMRNMLSCLDTNTNPYYWIWNVNRWINTRFSLLSSTILGISAALCLVTPSINAPLAGFILAFASTVNEDILYAVRFFVQLEQSMIAIERIQEFSAIEPEAAESTGVVPPKDWPAEGAISCENLSVRYAPQLRDVLHDLNFSIQPKEKIGILGRTGSGKSTLALSLFRFVEASTGHIFIDGIDISKLGLANLRRTINIIPQDPVVLSGTIRSTLDIFGEHSDAEIYDALRRVHLIPTHGGPEIKGLSSSKFANLDAVVCEGGDNFSAGEKQLLCMARSLLKRAKILVMDEATASVDYGTDEHISHVIRQEFTESTVLTIAHRLRTVIDYDRVMLLEDGAIIEFESPRKLLNDPKSRLYALCKATGSEEFNVLKQLSSAVP